MAGRAAGGGAVIKASPRSELGVLGAPLPGEAAQNAGRGGSAAELRERGPGGESGAGGSRLPRSRQRRRARRRALGAPGAASPAAALVFEPRACRHDSAVSKYSRRVRECSGEQLLNEHKWPFFCEAAEALHTIRTEIYAGRLQFASTWSCAVYILCN